MNAPQDNPLLKWLLLYVALGATALIVAFGVGGDPLAERVVQFFLPAGAVLLVLVQGGKQNATLDRIDTNTNGGLAAKFGAINRRIDDLAALIEQRLPPTD